MLVARGGRHHHRARCSAAIDAQGRVMDAPLTAQVVALRVRRRAQLAGFYGEWKERLGGRCWSLLQNVGIH